MAHADQRPQLDEAVSYALEVARSAARQRLWRVAPQVLKQLAIGELDMTDIKCALRSGTVRSVQRRSNHWCFIVEGPNAFGERMVVEFAIRDDKRVALLLAERVSNRAPLVASGKKKGLLAG